jgi:hypothetical protein
MAFETTLRVWAVQFFFFPRNQPRFKLPFTAAKFQAPNCQAPDFLSIDYYIPRATAGVGTKLIANDYSLYSE